MSETPGNAANGSRCRGSLHRRAPPFTVTEDLAGSRVDAGLARLMDISRSQAATLIAEGNVTSNGKEVGKSLKLTPGTVLEVVCRNGGTPWKSWRKSWTTC